MKNHFRFERSDYFSNQPVIPDIANHRLRVHFAAHDIKGIWLRRWFQRQPGDLSVHALQPFGKPCALKSGVPSHQNPLRPPKICVDHLPDLPGSSSSFPKRLQQLPISHSVHGLPEALVLVGHQLVIGRKFLERRLLEHRVLAHVLHGIALKDKKPSVDPASAGLRLLTEFADPVTIELQASETGGWANGGDCNQASVLFMKNKQSIEVYV